MNANTKPKSANPNATDQLREATGSRCRLQPPSPSKRVWQRPIALPEVENSFQRSFLRVAAALMPKAARAAPVLAENSVCRRQKRLMA